MNGVPSNTRFNPTVNGPLHLGHLYMCLVNQHEAHANGGKFVLRFDDTQDAWNDRLGKEYVRDCAQGMLADLAWAGVAPDVVEYQSMISEEAHRRLRAFCRAAGVPVPADRYNDQPFPYVPGHGQAYPYAPFKTAEKVVMDNMEGVTVLIRGDDLVGEFSLYTYFCEAFGLTKPDHVYLPRLRYPGGLQVSKTLCNGKISAYREKGWRPVDLNEMLACSCLRDTGAGWRVENLFEQPEINNAIEESS